jgi:pyruvate,water dikinase
VTTDDLVVDKRSGLVLSRTVADKAVMTVYGETGTLERPVPEDQRSRPVLPDADVAALVALGRRIEDLFRSPQDVEWARAGGELFVVQARPITSLPEPSAEPPSDWTVPFPNSFYFRASIVEQLPDPLSPLFADLIDPAVTKSLLALFRKFLGPRAVREGELGLPTVNGYAYYRYTRGALIRATLYSATAMRLVFSPGTAGGQARWRDHAHPRYATTVESWTGRDLAGLDDDQLLAGVVELLAAGAEYYTSVQAIIPLAASTEVAFSAFYDRSVRRPTDPPATAFLLGFDSVPILAEKSLYDLATWTRAHDAVTARLLAADGATRAGASNGTSGDVGLPDGEESPEWQEFARRWREHLTRFGHTVYNLDFRNPVPADDPAPMLATLRMYLRGEGTDPHRRQQALAVRRDEATAAVLGRLDPVRRKVFERLLRWAQRNAPLREDALADVGLAWPRMRRMLAELGRRLVAADRIESPDDVFWLHPDELLGRARIPADAVRQRKALWRGQLRATPPQMLPRGTVLDRLEAFMPAVEQDETGDVLKGTGASGGRVTATARVLAGPADFGRMRPGDVLVTSITTPAWTSLFAMASAVVTDVGGPLSHSSIVAREYGIPAVLGTNVATRRIPDGARLLVDGDAGTVTLLDGEGQDGEGRAAAGQEVSGQEREAARVKRDRTRRIALGTGAAVLGGAVVVRRRRAHRP